MRKHLTLWNACFGPEKDRCVFAAASMNKKLNHRIHRGFGPVASEHRQHPWRWQSSSWHAQCRWQHHGWHSQGKPWGHLGSPHRSSQRYAWHHLGEPDGGWRAWWYPGCYHAKLCDDAWRLPCRVLCLLCLFQSCWLLSECSNQNDADSRFFSLYILPTTADCKI